MLTKLFLIAAGIISLTLGIIGIFLPLLPTTPFLLLSAACFVRSSDRLYQWLITHKWFGAYIRNYREHKAITKQSKIIAITLLWATIGTTAIFFMEKLWIRVLLAGIAVGVTVHILKFKTLTEEMIKTSKGNAN
jgi:uncharacterized membrane protein YbaN (DUF454 family)